MLDDSSQQTPQAEVDGASAYEALFVPALFAQWAPRVADAAQIRPGDRVLDVACGTGVLAREVAARTGAAESVAGVDASRGMLAVARRLAPRIEWHHAAAESLPFTDALFDAVVSQFGLMFFVDRRQALREMLRVLRPAGRLALAVWSSLDDTPAYAREVQLLERVAGREAADALRAPFVLGDSGILAALLEDAGVPAHHIATYHGTARFPSIRSMVEADLRGWLPLVGVPLSEPQIDTILREAEGVLSMYAAPDGRVTFDAPAHVVTARKAPA